MSLDQILGLSYEIKILDFLLMNKDLSYTIDELQDYTEIDTGIIEYLLPKLEYNGLIKVENNKIKVASNEITSALSKVVFENSCLIANYPEDVNENTFIKWKLHKNKTR